MTNQELDELAINKASIGLMKRVSSLEANALRAEPCSVVGQIQIFLAGGEIVSRRLNWDGYDENSRRQIQDAVFEQLDLFFGLLVRPVPSWKLESIRAPAYRL